VKRPSFNTSVLLSNTASVEANRRYVETDMNRCFLLKDLKDSSLQTLEHKRAREIDALLGPKASENPSADLVLDLHNTTANTGFLLLIAPHDDFSHLVGAYLMSKDPEVRICQWIDKPDWSLLPTVGRSGMTVEVGPMAHSTSQASWFQKTKDHILTALDFVEAHNQGLSEQPNGGKRGPPGKEISIDVFRKVGDINFPRDEAGDLNGLIHPELQGNDFKEMKHGDPAFMLHDGSTQSFDKSKFDVEAGTQLYAFFVNEAAYYEKDIAFCVCRKVQRPVQVPGWLTSLL